MSTHEQDIKSIERMLEREAKNDAAALKHTLRDLEAANKAEVKSERMTDKAVHAHEKAGRKEHDAAKALNKAQHAHEARVADEQSALKTIEIKKQHQERLAADVEKKKASLDAMQKRKETNDASRALREQKIVQLHSHGASNGTVEPTTMAVDPNMPVTDSPAKGVGASAA
ncbi:hypothetical protein FRC06_011452 [Ceratobasidium sp. 370]|nr:hypothetical protein FRC06_011452 [Ceratobasidium sp. 370]